MGWQDFLTGERFKKAFGAYVKPFLRKGVPSLFSDIKPLYKDPAKVQLMGDLMNENLALLRSAQKLVGEAEVEPPVTILWVLEYLSNHCDRTGDSVKALQHINDALSYTPTVIDLHLTKARIYKVASLLLFRPPSSSTSFPPPSLLLLSSSSSPSLPPPRPFSSSQAPFIQPSPRSLPARNVAKPVPRTSGSDGRGAQDAAHAPRPLGSKHAARAQTATDRRTARAYAMTCVRVWPMACGTTHEHTHTHTHTHTLTHTHGSTRETWRRHRTSAKRRARWIWPTGSSTP